jgi:hypothetical protein
MALAYIRRKTASGWLGGRFLGMPLEDLALDCIAPLFERSAKGVFIILRKYFAGAELQASSEFALTAMTRRLVFSKVNQEFVAHFRDEDPGLARIIRNSRLALRSHRVLVHDGRTDFVVLRSMEATPDEVQPLPPELLVEYLTPLMHGNPTIPRLLDMLAEVLLSQKSHRPAVPLVQLALAIRQASIATGTVFSDECQQESLQRADTRIIIDVSLAAVKKQMAQTYLGRKGLASEVYDAYFRALRRKLCSEYVDGDGEHTSLFEHLSAEESTLTEVDYQSSHRVILEYLMALTRERLKSELRTEFS